MTISQSYDVSVSSVGLEKPGLNKPSAVNITINAQVPFSANVSSRATSPSESATVQGVTQTLDVGYRSQYPTLPHLQHALQAAELSLLGGQ